MGYVNRVKPYISCVCVCVCVCVVVVVVVAGGNNT